MSWRRLGGALLLLIVAGAAACRQRREPSVTVTMPVGPPGARVLRTDGAPPLPAEYRLQVTPAD